MAYGQKRPRLRHYRKRDATRSHTIQISRIRPRLVRADHAETATYLEPIPRTWGECQERALGTPTNPCWYLRCRYNLLLDVSPDTGSYKVTWPDLTDGHYGDEYRELPAHTCALHEASQGGMTLDEVGLMLNVTRERVRQIETKALHALRELDALVRAVHDLDDAPLAIDVRNGDEIYETW